MEGMNKNENTIAEPSDNWQKSDDWQKNALTLLSGYLARQELVGYDQLAQDIGLTGAHRIHRLTKWLEALIADDVRYHRPLRAAAAVSKLSGMPAPGFFVHCQALGIYDGPDKGPEAAAFHAACLRPFGYQLFEHQS